MVNDIFKIGKTEFQLIENYLPPYKDDANKELETIKRTFNASKPILIPLARNPSFTSSDRNSEPSPGFTFIGFSPNGQPICSPIGKPIGHLHKEACKRKPYGNILKCSKIITS